MSLVYHLQAIIRGVCAIIDAFRFSVSGTGTAPANLHEVSEQPEEEGLEQGLEAEDGPAEESTEQVLASQAAAESAHKSIQAALMRRVLPSLRSQLVHDGEVSHSMHALLYCIDLQKSACTASAGLPVQCFLGDHRLSSLDQL